MENAAANPSRKALYPKWTALGYTFAAFVSKLAEYAAAAYAFSGGCGVWGGGDGVGHHYAASNRAV